MLRILEILVKTRLNLQGVSEEAGGEEIDVAHLRKGLEILFCRKLYFGDNKDKLESCAATSLLAPKHQIVVGFVSEGNLFGACVFVQPLNLT